MANIYSDTAMAVSYTCFIVWRLAMGRNYVGLFYVALPSSQEFVAMSHIVLQHTPNKALHLTLIPLRCIRANELGR